MFFTVYLTGGFVVKKFPGNKEINVKDAIIAPFSEHFKLNLLFYSPRRRHLRSGE